MILLNPIMMNHVGDILLISALVIKYFEWDIIGLPCFEIPRNMCSLVIAVNAWASLLKLMKCHSKHS